MTTVTIREVGPGDGLRSERPLRVQARVALIEALVGAGIRHVEAAAFVSPASMAGAAEVIAALERRAGVWYWAMVADVRGAARALEAEVDALTVTVSASEVHSHHTAHASVDESVAEAERIGALVHHQLPLDAVISCAFGSPYEGDIAPAAVVELGARLLDGGASSVTLADTTGMATPRRVAEILDATGNGVGLHLHETRGTGLLNAYAALEAGVTRFDTSIGGLGGVSCSEGDAGNVGTEDLVHLLDDLRVDTGVDLERLLEISRLFADTVGHTLPSRLAAAGPRWRLAGA